MASKMNVAYVEINSTEENLRVIRSNWIITADMVEINVKVKFMAHQSGYNYGGIRSAINHVYILKRLQMPERMKRELSIFSTGMERIVIAVKQILGIKYSKSKIH